MRKNIKIFCLLLSAALLAAACGANSNAPSGNAQPANAASGGAGNSSAAENKAVENKATPAPKPTKAPDEMPKFEKGEAYRGVREKLIKAGWTPFKSKEADECRGDDPRCKDFPEMEACAGTGLANCRYLWKKGDKTLAIMTIGESPEYSGQEFVKKSEQNPSDKDDGSWRGGAFVHSPPTNVRETPDGKILCVIKEKKMIQLQGSTNIEDENGEWIRTNACGKPGVIHSSQINLAN